MSPTLALEALMMHPRYAELAERLRAGLPSHLVDQADAAAGHTDDIVAALTGLLGGRAGATAPAQLEGWLRLGVIDAWLDYATGRAATCRHNPTARRPQPVLAAAWRPGLITCVGCAHLFTLPRNTDADRTCDCCGRVVAGSEAEDPMWPSLIQCGPLVFQYGTCTDCKPPTDQGAENSPLSSTLSQDRGHPRGSGRADPRGRRGRGRGRGGQR